MCQKGVGVIARKLNPTRYLSQYLKFLYVIVKDHCFPQQGHFTRMHLMDMSAWSLPTRIVVDVSFL